METGGADDLRRWASALVVAADAVGPLLAALPGAWADAAGREWAERLYLVRAALDRAAEEALRLARAVETDPPPCAADRLPPVGAGRAPGVADPAPRPDRDTERPPDGSVAGLIGGIVGGVRPGGQDGTRATGRRGVVVPTLAPARPG